MLRQSADPRPDGDPPFAAFIAGVREQSPMRIAITAAYRRSEPECVASLVAQATLPEAMRFNIEKRARELAHTLRAQKHPGAVQSLIHEYALSSQEGVALMCLAEALLRIPDTATRNALIRDKISRGDWKSHLGQSPSLFVNAATWGLLITGKLTSASSESGLSAALTKLIARSGEPVVRGSVDFAMRLMGEQFVTGQTIEQALRRSKAMELKGFRYSYDMLGEAAVTAEDAARYCKDYETAIHAIGHASNQGGVYDGPGISIKLSALHPRYSRAQIGRVMGELLPRVTSLARLAKRYDIGLNIDAEEADRLEVSLDLLEALALDPDLAGWQGLGFVVQAYGKRCPFVIDWLIDLARRTNRRLMVRLVKGAYWDAEIKRAQVDGLNDFPVFTRKAHTDVSFLACARRLLDAPDAVFPQFATHNAQTVASIYEMAGPAFHHGQYEFQCLHGMGEPLYQEVVGDQKLARPCRIYAPVGTHETLLAYLVRRLLENGANASFVNRIADERVPIDDLIADPVETVAREQNIGSSHENIRAPQRLYAPSWSNSKGLDLSNEAELAELGRGLEKSRDLAWTARPTIGEGASAVPVLNPANHTDKVGEVRVAAPDEIDAAVAGATAGFSQWSSTSVKARADMLRRAADAMEVRMPILMGLIVREAGKSYPNAIAEVREAVDFLRYYAAEALRTMAGAAHRPVGPIASIAPWNFPLAIFVGQIAAALAAGNTVLAKPAEETPLVAAEAVRILHEAGVPLDALLLVPGAGEVGAALVSDTRIMGVVFTGSTGVARLIQRQLSSRLLPDGRPLPLIAETGGLNALIVDSSALAEQVVADVTASAFDSAGQRCSALRLLCLQEDIAERTLTMLTGAMRELSVGDPALLPTDVGPVISVEAKTAIEAHVDGMEARGHRVTRMQLRPALEHRGTFVAPAIVEVDRVGDVEREVFGPVLHVLRFRRSELDRLIADLNATGYGLTFGLHTRMDDAVDYISARIGAGNIYVNRNIIGATVGVQPFGGSGLSGTGPKAGGPLYLSRFSSGAANHAFPQENRAVTSDGAARAFGNWLRANGHANVAEKVEEYATVSPVGTTIELPGPVGERNVYTLKPRGLIAVVGSSATAQHILTGAALATGNNVIVQSAPDAAMHAASLPMTLQARINLTEILAPTQGIRAVLTDRSGSDLIALLQNLAAWEGPIVPVITMTTASARTELDIDLTRLVEEVTITTNTAAAGGNASLMTLA